MHYVDGRNGVKDLDVWTFFAESGAGPFPHRWRRERVFELPPFEGHYVDLIGRSLREPADVDPVEALRRYLSEGRTASAKALSLKASVLLHPQRLRGTVAWPPGAEGDR